MEQQMIEEPYLVEHSCGHEVDLKRSFRHKLEGQGIKVMLELASWVSSVPCVLCMGEDATEFEAQNNLPELSGTVKQVAWARSIRTECFSIGMQVYPLLLEEYIGTTKIREEKTGLNLLYYTFRIFQHNLRKQDEASWWIKNKEAILNEITTVVTNVMDYVNEEVCANLFAWDSNIKSIFMNISPVKYTPKDKFQVQLPADLAQRIQEHAEKADLSLKDAMCEAVTKYLEG